MARSLHHRLVISLLGTAFMLAGAEASARSQLGGPPAGFISGTIQENGMHYVRGGNGPVVVLVHGFPENWVEYREIMPALAKRFTVVAVDLPGIGHSSPSNGYDAYSIADQIHTLVEKLKINRPYLVGHDLGGIVSYAYVRRFPNALRGAMILDVPIPGVAGWKESTGALWHIGFIQAPKQLAETLVDGRPAAFLGWCYDQGKFTAAERAYYIKSYGSPQIHAAFGIYRAFPKDENLNSEQTSGNSTPVVVAVGEKSPFASYQQTMIAGYKAKGMKQVEAAVIPGAGHYVVADNPNGTADIIVRYAGQ